MWDVQRLWNQLQISIRKLDVDEFKKCNWYPKCGTPVEKIKGCNHMICNQCHSHICWFLGLFRLFRFWPVVLCTFKGKIVACPKHCWLLSLYAEMRYFLIVKYSLHVYYLIFGNIMSGSWSNLHHMHDDVTCAMMMTWGL